MRAKTIRKLPGPLSRELANLQNETQSIKRRLDRLIRMAAEAELKAIALDNMNSHSATESKARDGDTD